MTDPAERTYYWDFYGPRAAPTAEHFERHLRGFLEQHSVGALPLVRRSNGPGHAAVGVVAPAAHFELIERALRPKRFD